jgi:acyl phosphate:glycerol-3-phosphate acyltransferase
MLTDTLALLASYLLGSIPFGYLIVKMSSGKDVRASGSGATGATNVMRTAGKKAGLMTFALDIAKGFVAVLAARWIIGVGLWETNWVVAAAAFLAIVGHVFPVWLGFKAGKGVATGVGVFLAIAPLAVVCALAVFALILKATRYVSLGSVIASALMLPLMLFWNGLVFPSPYLTQMLAAVGAVVALIIVKHADNIRRLMAGTENKFGAAKK